MKLCYLKKKKKRKKKLEIVFACTGCRPGVVSALDEFKLSVYGDGDDVESELVHNGKASETSKKRKAIAENAFKECANFDWDDLADSGKVRSIVLILVFFPGPKRKRILLLGAKLMELRLVGSV